MPRGRTCLVCTHDQRKAIDLSLGNGIPSAALSRKYAVSADSLDRHRLKHLRPAIARAAAMRTDLSAQALLERLAELLDRCDRAMNETEKSRDFKTLGTLIRESRELTVTIGRTVGLWTDKPAIVNDNRKTLMINLDMKSLEELVSMRSALEELGVMPAAIEG